MQFLIVLSAAVALASATPGYLGALGHHGAYADSHHLDPVGDTFEVAAAKANHFQAHSNARLGHGIAPYGGVHSYGAYGVPVYHGGYASNILTPSGDTIEVAAAKAAHFQAHVNARAGHGLAVYANGIGTYGDFESTHLVDPVAIAVGAPLPVEVTAPKAAHIQANVNAKSGLVGGERVVYSAPLSIATHAYAAAAAAAVPVVSGSTQYHAQDALGQYSYGYADSNSAKHETRASDGTTHGGYSYVDGNGIVQSVKYQADALGFRAHGTNFPIAA